MTRYTTNVRSSRLTSAFLVVSVALLLVACGGDDDRLSAGEFREQANAVCADTDREFEAAFEELSIPEDEEPTPEQLQQIAATMAPLVDRGIDRLADLEPPEDIEDDWDAVIDKGRAVQNRFEEAAEDLQAAQELFSGEDAFAEINHEMGRLGITECAEEDE